MTVNLRKARPVSLKKSPSQIIDPARSYAGFIREEGTLTRFAILGGGSVIAVLNTSPNAHLLEFQVIR